MNAPAPLARPPLVVEGLYSFQIGGSERLGAELALAFTARGYRVAVVSFYDAAGPMRDLLEARGVRCVGFDFHGRRRIGRPWLQWRMYGWFASERPHAVHFQHALTLNLAGRAARLAGVPSIVMTEHADEALRGQPRYRHNSARSCARADGVTTVHAELADFFARELAVPRTKLRVIRNGVAVPAAIGAEERSRRRWQVRATPADFVFMFIGRLHPDKDLPVLLQAAALLVREHGPRFRVALLGDGPERAALEERARAAGLGDVVVFAGARSDARELLAGADAFVMTSRTEGLPMALLEAMAQGLPCIATAVGGIPEVLEGGAGLCIPARDPSATAAAMGRLLGDEPLRQSLGAAALARVRDRYDFEETVTAYLSALGLPPRWAPRRARHRRSGPRLLRMPRPQE